MLISEVGGSLMLQCAGSAAVVPIWLIWLIEPDGIMVVLLGNNLINVAKKTLRQTPPVAVEAVKTVCFTV